MQTLERANDRIKEEEVLRRITEQELSQPDESRISEEQEVLRPGEYGRLMAQCSILAVIAGIVVSIVVL
jgi:hypothetical protein